MGPEVKKKKTDLHKPRSFANAFCFIDDLCLVNDNGLFETFQRVEERDKIIKKSLIKFLINRIVSHFESSYLCLYALR